MKQILLVLMLTAAMGGMAARAQTIQAVTETTSYTYLKDGKVSGGATKVVEATLRSAGLTDFQINLYPWARGYDMALRDPNVLIYLIARTPPRENLFKWVGELVKTEYHLYKLKDRSDVDVINGLQDAKGYVIGTMRDDVRYQYLKAQGFTKLVVSAENSDLFKRLLNRQIQLIPLADNDALALCEEARFDCAGLEKAYTLDQLSTGLYMAFSKPTPDPVVDRAKAAFQKLKADGTVSKLIAGKP